MPEANGSATPSTACTVIAASIAEPPRARTLQPAMEALMSADVTIRLVPARPAVWPYGAPGCAAHKAGSNCTVRVGGCGESDGVGLATRSARRPPPPPQAARAQAVAARSTAREKKGMGRKLRLGWAPGVQGRGHGA